MCRRVILVILALSLMGLGSALGKAEAADSTIDAYVRYMPGRSVEAMSGGVGIIESSSEYSYALKAFGKLPLELSLETKYIAIENTTAVELPAHLTGIITDLETTLPFFKLEKTYIRVGLSPSFYSDDWDFPGSAFRIPVRLFLIRQPNSQWTFVGGVAIFPDFQAKIWPILGFIYQPNEKLIFNLVPERPNITYWLNNKVAVFGEGGFSNKEFEVKYDGLKNTVLRFRDTRLGAGVIFKFNKNMRSHISSGAVFNRSLKYRDSLGKVNIKNNFYTEFRTEIMF